MPAPAPGPNRSCNRPQWPESAVAILLWLALQLAALAASAFRFTLWARMPPAPEQLALPVMLATQVAAAALLFPALLRDFRAAAIAIATAWPMAQLASFLGDADAATWAAGELYVSFWLITLYVWGRAIGVPWLRLYAAALAGVISLGGPVLWYLHAEFTQAGASINWSHAALLGPILGALSQILPAQRLWTAWEMPAALFGIGVIVQFLARRGPRPAAAR